ncbi:FG-GAP-like repeat-containing protein [Chitinophaga filiformis]|uniref:Por secretion system C-terminal sorting domain-containing protein n=1 Tax=Chitinophaga filiformis TaxID=104663 RepID=A0A1G7Z7Z8_CHIFI|nr:FG-GAP-like repeat-containing protein [Chitinophaga filiformis]SDH04873.1 Por secretion system C-terminal sorting domain-containing protein [Chitinophaga filiformis]
MTFYNAVSSIVKHCITLIPCTLFLAFASAQKPVIASFSPASGPAGTIVTITGSNFGSVASENIVSFGAVRAQVLNASSTQLSVSVPGGATYQPITVVTNGLTAFSAQPFMATFPSHANVFSALSFAPAVDIPTGPIPYSVVIADFNGDGRTDVATANYDTGDASSVTILQNSGGNGKLAFAAKFNLALPANSGAYSITAADLDGDGKPELIVANNLSYTASVFRNTSSVGAISFAAGIQFATGNGTFSVSVGDLDGDGRPDLAASNYLAGTVSLLRNTSVSGTISFAPAIDVRTDVGPKFVSIGDLDGDNRPDLVTANDLSKTISILRNTSSQGSLSFATMQNASVSGAPDNVAIGDLDGDGKNDLAVSDNTNSLLHLYRSTGNSGSIALADGIDLYQPYPTRFVSIGDLSGDGKPDLVSATQFGVYLYQNNSTSGTISFVNPYFYYVYTPGTLQVGDLDGDNLPDIVASNMVANGISIFRNRIPYPHISSFSPATAAQGQTVSIKGSNFTGTSRVDFGGMPCTSFVVDGDTSITAVVGGGVSGHITITNGVGTDSADNFVFAGPPVVSSFTPNIGFVSASISITGYNFTGCTGVSFGGRPAASFTVVSPTSITALVDSGATGDVAVSTLYGTGTKAGFTFILPPVISSFTPSSAKNGDTVIITGENLATATNVSFGPLPAGSFSVVSPTSISAVVAAGSTGAVTVRTIGGSASLNGFKFITGPPPVISSFSPVSGSTGTTVVVQGLNFNTTAANNVVYFGAYRAQVSDASANSLTVIVPAGAQFGPITVINTGNGLQAVSQGFFTPLYSKTVAIDSNTFVSMQHFNDDYQSWNSTLADFDGDGKMDVAGESLSSTVSIKRNTSSPGDLSFAPEQHYHITSPYAGGSFVGPITAADIDGDGRMDIVAVDYIVNDLCYIGVLRNTSTPGQISFEDEVKFEAVYNAFALTVADVDGDGRPDILVQGQGASGVLLNNSSIGVTSFLPQQDFPFGAIAACGDFNNDGKIDLVNSGDYFSSHPFSILENTSSVGMPNFTRIPLFTPEYEHDPIRVSVADLDGDEKLDLLIANGDGANFGFRTTCRNTGTGSTISFDVNETALPKVIQTGVAGDVDGDGKPDMVVSNAYDLTVGVARNTSTPGNISFADNFWNPSRMWSSVLNVADMDGDGKADLVMSGYGSDLGFSVLLNSGGQRPSIKAVGDAAFCKGDSVLLVSSLPYSNQWYENGLAIPGANNESLMVHNGGTYTTATSTSEPSDALLVTVRPIPDKPSISWSATAGMVSSAGVGNQWYTDSPRAVINGAVAPTYKPVTEGYYLVQVTQDGCVSPFSDAYHYLFNGPAGTTSNGAVKVSPNPTVDFITVMIQADTTDIYTAELFGMDGQARLTVSPIVSGDRIDLSGLPPGMYFLKVTGTSGKFRRGVTVIKR